MLHMVCDLTIAADNAIFGQTGPKVCTQIIYLITSERSWYLFFKICAFGRLEALMLVMGVRSCPVW